MAVVVELLYDDERIVDNHGGGAAIWAGILDAVGGLKAAIE